MRPVPDFPGYYADWFGTIYNNEKPRTLCTNKTHKNFISVYLDGKVQHVSAAKLVCMAFNGRPMCTEFKMGYSWRTQFKNI